MSQITIDDRTRLISAASISIKGMRKKGAQPIDFARDTILILDPATNRPLATCQPLPSVKASPPPPPPLPAEGDEASGGGRLSDAEREKLERLWAKNSTFSAAAIAAMFGKETGRSITWQTAERWRPEAPKGRK